MAIPDPRLRKIDVQTHYYPPVYFDRISETPSDFSFGKSDFSIWFIT